MTGYVPWCSRYRPPSASHTSVPSKSGARETPSGGISKNALIMVMLSVLPNESGRQMTLMPARESRTSAMSMVLSTKAKDSAMGTKPS